MCVCYAQKFGLAATVVFFDLVFILQVGFVRVCSSCIYCLFVDLGCLTILMFLYMFFMYNSFESWTQTWPNPWSLKVAQSGEKQNSQMRAPFHYCRGSPPSLSFHFFFSPFFWYLTCITSNLVAKAIVAITKNSTSCLSQKEKKMVERRVLAFLLNDQQRELLWLQQALEELG